MGEIIKDEIIRNAVLKCTFLISDIEINENLEEKEMEINMQIISHNLLDILGKLYDYEKISKTGMDTLKELIEKAYLSKTRDFYLMKKAFNYAAYTAIRNKI